MTTNSINTVDAKEAFSELISRVSHHKERIILTRRGHPIAALIPMEDFNHLEETKAKSDLDEAILALKEAREHGFISLTDIKNELN
jgi:prevent-host-death family protein